MNDHPSRPLDPTELLVQRAWMRRFAAALAGAEGEDLVQEAWVRVLTARAPALAQPRAWLASVLRNAARMGKRAAVRREQREAQAAREEALAPTDELVAQAELEQLAVRAVLALSAPYRQALLLRYARDLEPSEIARQLELPPSTVRNRIARGLAEVRAELDRRHGRREAWLALLMPRAVLGKGTATMVLGGGSWMSWMSAKWIAAVALAAAAGLLWVGRPARTPALHAPESSAAAAPAATATLAPKPLADPSPVAAATARRSALPTNVLPMTAAELLVHVTWARDGSPAADVPLRVESVDAEPYPLETTGTTDASGTARFTALPPGEQRVDTGRVAQRVQLVPGEPQTLELAIPRGLDVDCRVVDSEGAGVAGAEVWLSDQSSSYSGMVVGCTDAGGWLHLRDLPCREERALAARATGHAPSTQYGFGGHPGARLTVELVLPGPGASLAGLVQDTSGTPLGGVEVLIGAELTDDGQREDGQIVPDAPPRQVTSDADGSFLVHGLAPGPLEVHARAPGYGTADVEVELAPGETGRCTLVLPAEARVAGVARDGDGRPLAGVQITGGARWWVESIGSVGPFCGREAHTAADGSFVLGGLEAGRWTIEANGGTNGHTRSTLQLHAGEETRWDVVLTAGGVVAGVVLDERGAPLAHWHVVAVEHGDSQRWLRSASSDEAGRFRIEDCPAQRFVLALHSPEEERGDPVLVFEDFRVGDETLVLRAMDACRPSAFVEGRLVASDGGPLGEMQLQCSSVHTGGDSRMPDADGRFRMGPLRSGEYTLFACSSLLDRPLQLYAPRFALEAGETKDLGDLVLQRCGWIRVRAVAKGGGALPAGTVLEDLEVQGVPGRFLCIGDALSFEGLQGRSEPL